MKENYKTRPNSSENYLFSAKSNCGTLTHQSSIDSLHLSLYIIKTFKIQQLFYKSHPLFECSEQEIKIQRLCSIAESSL